MSFRCASYPTFTAAMRSLRTGRGFGLFDRFLSSDDGGGGAVLFCSLVALLPPVLSCRAMKVRFGDIDLEARNRIRSLLPLIPSIEYTRVMIVMSCTFSCIGGGSDVDVVFLCRPRLEELVLSSSVAVVVDSDDGDCCSGVFFFFIASKYPGKALAGRFTSSSVENTSSKSSPKNTEGTDCDVLRAVCLLSALLAAMRGAPGEGRSTS